ncbi:MAG: hypothetical protein P8X68_21770 [Desulfobacterales bacterium]|jgi:hypothetical protein
MKKAFWLIFLLGAAGFMACAHTGGFSQPASYSFTVDIPEGWRKIDNNRYLFLTKESPFLQYVLVQNRPIDKRFRHTKKIMQKNMLPEEAAQIIIDEIASDENILNFNVLANSPAEIQGYDGFRILFAYDDKEGSRYKTLYYGFIKEDTFFNLRYTAAEQDYFEQDVGTFKEMLNSFHVVEAGKTQPASPTGESI